MSRRTWFFPDSGPFSPTDPDMIVWLKPDHGLTFNGSNRITAWTDFSSAGNSPTSFPAGVRAGGLNGYATVGPDLPAGGGAIYIKSDPARYLQNTVAPDLTFLSVFKMAPVADVAILNFGVSGYYNASRGLCGDDYPAGIGLHYYGGTFAIPYTFTVGQWYNVAMTVEEDPGAGTANVEGYVNGAYVGSVTATGLAARSLGASCDMLGVGSVDFEIAELLAFKRKLTPSELTGFQSYLQSKYGL